MNRSRIVWATVALVSVILVIGGIFGYYYSLRLSQSLDVLDWRADAKARIDNIATHVSLDVDRVTFSHPVALTDEERERLFVESLDTALTAQEFPDYYDIIVYHNNHLVVDEGNFVDSVFACGAALDIERCSQRVGTFLLENVTPSISNQYAHYIVDGKAYYVVARSVPINQEQWNMYFVVAKDDVMSNFGSTGKNFSWSVVLMIFILFFAISALVTFSIMRIYESEKKYSLIVRNANDIIFVCDRRGKIVDLNPAADNLLGKGARNHNICRYIMSGSCDVDKLFEMGKDEECVEIEFAAGTKSAVLECLMSTVDIGGNAHVFIIARDITMRKQLEKRAEIIYALSHKLLKVDTVDDVCTVVIEAVKDLLFFENVGVFMLNKYDQLYLRATNLEDVSFSENISNKNNVIHHGFNTSMMLTINKLSKGNIDFLDKRSTVEAAVPLIAGGERVGVLFLGSRKQNFAHLFADPQFSVIAQARDKYLSVLASEVAIAIKNIQYRNELRNWRDKLDKMVHERTEELHAANLELRRQDELKNEFVNVVGHELRTPLTSIRGFTEVLTEMSDNLTDEQQEYLGVIRSETDRLSELINDMLDVSKIEAGRMEMRPERFDLVELLRTCPLYHQAKDKGLGIKFDFPKSKLMVYADKDRLQQVLINLVSNAIKFTEKGTITVGFDLLIKGRVRVYIEDTGIGIKEKDINHVFEKFYQTENHLRRKVGGSGLGLNISKRIVELHRGSIGVTSEHEKGSRFWFVIPLAYEKEKKETFTKSIVDQYY